MRQYEIWWAELPEPIGTRPVLLLSRNGAYQYLSRVLAVEVTTKIRAIPQELVLGRRDGMPQRCVANFDNLLAVPVSTLVEQIGGLSAGRIIEVKHALGHAVGWIELTSLA
ncbi:MAG TPA: type II toxin-antitoxin system PemK/MazF family toxin [Kofleriaceae bacterium]|nr:type II toxin-antitoxin system PemK/MazF family toxin [Kofleriaceae bacterium]